MYIEEGLVKLDVSSGKRISTVSLMSSKSFIGIICTFASRNLSFSATAIEKTRISLFDIDLFEKFIRQNGSFAFHLIRHTSAMTSQIVHHISKFSHKNIDGTLSLLLCDFAKIYKTDSFTLPVNRKEMANMLGYSKESVINTLSKFNREGIISVNDKKIEIIDKEMLMQIGETG
jgi:CRP-like cAMP-binding protein